MLSTFTARPLIELKARDKSKIETILAYGDRILVGLNTGSLRIYRVNDLSPPPSSPVDVQGGSDAVGTSARPTKHGASRRPTDLLREYEKFSTRAVEKLAIVKEANTLVSLSNYAVHLHDLERITTIHSPLPSTKNASTFAVTSNIVKDSITGIPDIISRLAVAVKRKLLLWSWHESELSPDVVDILLPEAIRTVAWATATKVLCGMNGGYVLIDVVSRLVYDIVAPGGIMAAGQANRFGAVSMGYMGLGAYMPKPLAAKLSEGTVLLAKDINTLFVDGESGNALAKRQIPWQSAPEAIGYSYPYILSLQSPAKGVLEVRNPETLTLLQKIPLPAASQLHCPQQTVSLAHAAKGFHVSSERTIWKMDAIDYDSQVVQLAKQAQYDEAISLINLLEDALLRNNKTETLRELKMLHAERLFRQKKYEKSMALFNDEQVKAPPERVLKLFPPIIAGDLSGVTESVDGDDDHTIDEQQQQKNATEETPHGNNNNSNKGVVAPHAVDKATAAEAMGEVAPPSAIGGGITRYLMGGGRKTTVDPPLAGAGAPKEAEVESPESVEARLAEEKAERLRQQEKDLMAAVVELNSYLAGARARLQRVIDPATGQLKARKTTTDGSTTTTDGSTTTTDDDAIKSLLVTNQDNNDNNGNDQLLEQDLRCTFEIVDTTLFRSFMLSKPTLASSLFRIPNFCNPEVVSERLLAHNRYHELVDFLCGKKLHRKALELLRRFGEPDHPDPAAPTLHGPQRTVVYLQNLPADLVDLILEFAEWPLRKDRRLGMDVFLVDSENAETLPRDRAIDFLGTIDVALEIQYLEHIINEWDDMTPDFHNRLVELSIRQLLEKPRDEEWQQLMDRLVRFLKESKQYGLTKTFALIPRDDPAFYEAQAVVLSSMGQHKQALEIYVFKLQDYSKAENYCNQVHKRQQESNPSPSAGPDQDAAQDRPSIYHTLLSLYLHPPPPHPQNLAPALALLSKHGSRLPAAATLALLPDALPVARLEAYFRGRIRAANSVIADARIRRGLQYTRLVASQAELLLGNGAGGGARGGRDRRVVISEERVCRVCHKRLGRSVVAVSPDNAVVHQGCLTREMGGPAKSGAAGSWARTRVGY